MNFYIQKINGEIEFDFQFHLIKAINYNNWFYNEKIYEYEFVESVEEIKNKGIPIGSLEFVKDYIEKIENKEMSKPINIPKILLEEKLLVREVQITNDLNEVFENDNEKLFIKSNDKYKDICGLYNINEAKKIPNGEYLVSEIVDFISEWRIFVHENKIVGVNQYLGEFIYPDLNFVQEIVDKYKSEIKSYTIDIGILEDGKNDIVEIHPFVSCGLYGFNDYKLMPIMMINGFKSIIN